MSKILTVLQRLTQLLGFNHAQHKILVAYEGRLYFDMQTVQLRYVVVRPAAQPNSRKEAATVKLPSAHTPEGLWGTESMHVDAQMLPFAAHWLGLQQPSGKGQNHGAQDEAHSMMTTVS